MQVGNRIKNLRSDEQKCGKSYNSRASRQEQSPESGRSLGRYINDPVDNSTVDKVFDALEASAKEKAY